MQSFWSRAASVPAALRWCGFAVATLYFFHFGILCFLLGPYDYNHLSSYYELAWRFWTTSPGWPQYNPFFCGGRTLGADPQVPVFHPLLGLVALVGSVTTLKWELLTQLAVGTWGLWRWLKWWRADETACWWGCLLFSSGGFVVGRFLVGHVTLGFYFLLPVYFYFSYLLSDPRCQQKKPVAIVLGALFAYCGFYKPNFFIYGLPPLFFEAACRSVLSRRLTPILALTAASAFAGLVCAVSLVPAAAYFSAFPREVDSEPKSVPLYSLVANLLVPLKTLPARWYGSVFMQRHEYSLFVGPVALYYAWRGAALWPQRAERLSLLWFALGSAWLGLGASSNHGSWGEAFTWLRHWPGFGSIRVPVRFWFGVYLAVIVFSALGFRWPKARWEQALVVLFGLFPLFSQAAINLSKVNWFATQPQWVPPSQYPLEIKQVHAPTDEPYNFIRQGNGVIECVDNINVLRCNTLKEGLLLAVQSAQAVSVRARWKTWSTIELTGQADTGTRFTFNFNHHPFWQVSGRGMKIVSKSHEPLTLEAVEGSFEGVLNFHQAYVKGGGVLSALALLTFVLGSVWILRRRNRPWRVGLTGGIASGKTTVASILREKGWWVVDLDAEARRLTDGDPQVQSELRTFVSPDVFDDKGRLDRQKLAELVFNDMEKRRALEAILHPRLLAIYEGRVRQAARRKVPAVACDAALLVESGHHRRFDKLMVVTAPLEVRKHRLKHDKGLSDAQIDARVSAQSPDETKVGLADFVISNVSDRQALEKQVQDVVKQLK